MYDPLCYEEQGAIPSPIGAATCLGDLNENQISDACEGGWIPGDDYKMHFPQLPDLDSGWNVQATMDFEGTICDDWTCTETGLIKALHFWGGWKDDHEAQLLGFGFIIYSNLSAEESPTGYSVPDQPLWQYMTEDFGMEYLEAPSSQGWYFPSLVFPDSIFDNNQTYYQYNVYIPDSVAFIQTKDSIYWLSIRPSYFNTHYWGWKSSGNHHGNNAIASMYPFDGGYVPPDQCTLMHEPGTISTNHRKNFIIANVAEDGYLWDGYGEQAYGDGWYYYDASGWWNIWSYNHPCAADHWTNILINMLNAVPNNYNDSTYIEIAINWSTDAWSESQAPGDSSPPLPGVDEYSFIGREIIFSGEPPIYFNDLPVNIPDSNPEWVSLSIQGYNFSLDGMLQHSYIGPVPMDLSFVVSSSGLCDCIPGDANGIPSYNILDATYLIAYLYKDGPAPAPYVNCSGDPNCNCSVNILDVTYLIAYLYKGGPAPCNCETWEASCGSL